MWLDQHSADAETVKDYRALADSFIVPALGDVKLTRLAQPGDVRGDSDSGQRQAGQPALTQSEVLRGLGGVLRQVPRDSLRSRISAGAGPDDLDVDLLTEAQQVQPAGHDGYGPAVSDSAMPGRATIFVRRFWWLQVVAGVCMLALAAYRMVERSNGWAVFAGIWLVVGLSQIAIGLLNRRESRRRG